MPVNTRDAPPVGRVDVMACCPRAGVLGHRAPVRNTAATGLVYNHGCMRTWWPPGRRRRRTRPAAAGLDPWGRFRIGLTGLALVLVIGSGGYVLLGLRPFDAVYQTAITITTVGFGEVGSDQVEGDAYRAFTLVLVLVGASTTVYTLSVLLESIVEGSLNDGLRKRRMSRQIDRLDNHIIVAGWGRVGRAIARYVRRHGAEVVIVDRDEADTGGLPQVVGDAHEDDTLLAAGIERASTLIAALDTDGANLALTLTARSLRDDLFVVARTAKQGNERKFFQAGANRVVCPHDIGGSRMGAVAMHPMVAEFLDEVLHDDGHDVRIVEVIVAADSPAINVALGELTAGGERALVIALRRADGRYVTNPRAGLLIGAHDVLIALGSEAETGALHRAVTRRRPRVFRGAEIG